MTISIVCINVRISAVDNSDIVKNIYVESYIHVCMYYRNLDAKQKWPEAVKIDAAEQSRPSLHAPQLRTFEF